jgi:SAM-dependent methyltransferase
MTIDPFAKFKAVQKEGWGLFAPIAAFTTVPAAGLVKFARVLAGEKVLDVACGTGVVAVTAAGAGAKVSALDLSPVLLDHARANARTAGVEVDFVEGDAEALPYADASFDVVLSQYGHMFAPRPEVAIAEMLRVLKPGGRFAFSTWPPDQYVGRMFALVGQYLPPPPGVAPPPAWGDPNVVRERLGDRVRDLHFDRDTMVFPVLSPAHYRALIEATAAPVATLVNQLQDQPERLAKFRAELDALTTAYIVDNALRQHYLMSRAVKL